MNQTINIAAVLMALSLFFCSPVAVKSPEWADRELRQNAPLSQEVTVMGVIIVEQKSQRVSLDPWIHYKNGEYTSLFLDPLLDQKEQKAVHWRRQVLKDFPDYWLYQQGETVGKFKLSRPVVPGAVSLTGEIEWLRKPANGWEKESKIIVLSRPIPQPFWLRSDSLSPEQQSQLEHLLIAALTRTPKELTEKWKRKQIFIQKPLQPDKRFHKAGRDLKVFDLDRDGQPEVYAEIIWTGKPCEQMIADLLATWKNKWQIIREATYWAYCPEVPGTFGDYYFDVIPIDIDGDGSPELIFEEVFYEMMQKVIFLYKDGKLIKKSVFWVGGL